MNPLATDKNKDKEDHKATVSGKVKAVTKAVKKIAASGVSAKSKEPVPEPQTKPVRKKASPKVSDTKISSTKAATKKSATKKTAAKKSVATAVVTKTPAKKRATKKIPSTTKKIIFQLRFHTVFGQEIFITGNHPLLGNNDPANAVALQYFNDEYWYLALDLPEAIDQPISYHYILRNADGIDDHDFGNDKSIDLSNIKTRELLLIDTWNYTGYVENTFYTKPFTEVLLKANHTPVAGKEATTATHVLKVKAPLLSRGQTLCVLGSSSTLGGWDTASPVLMHREPEENFFQIALDLSGESFPIAYKYGVYDVAKDTFVCFESGNNRVLFDTVSVNRTTLLHDGFAALPNTMWKGAGIAVPVFSLRSDKGFGTGEFSDLVLLVDWIKETGIKLIQLLPVNDTTATNTWRDSYPYSAISAFALHPLYMNLEKLAPDASKELQQLEKERIRLNGLSSLDYEGVTKAKNKFIAAIYKQKGMAVFQTEGYQDYFNKNKHWLVSYAAFCYLRDQNGTVDFNQWPSDKTYDEKKIAALVDKNVNETGLYFFTQYQLHLQLKEATAYARANGIVVKGDIPIGVSRHSVDAWQEPALYNMDHQAGAPPDDFSVKGQNWGFPTYDWQRMREDGFAWWKKRFAQMNDYFDAFRIDHILGFFRIWSVPMDSVEGIMGYFVPAIPVHINEFNSRGIWFDHSRYTKPLISEAILKEIFGDDSGLVKSMFLDKQEGDAYFLKPSFDTQRKVAQHFATLENDAQQLKIKQGLYDLISNVILFEAAGSNGQSFHFRFNMEHTSSYRQLDEATRHQLKELYVHYFFRRQDELWRREALQKLPELKRATEMLVCGEDLGLIPACVPDVMKQAGLLSLEIQRMPKDSADEFFHPNNAPYLSVVTPSTHDMSTIRGWWGEDRERTQRFYHHQLGQQGDAPEQCEAFISKAIVLQHLYSPAMWSIFQLQDLLGMDDNLRREDADAERINVPADPKHYWQYRMHIRLEQLIGETAFNSEVKKFVFASGR